MSQTAVHLFISCAAKDEAHAVSLLKHLHTSIRSGRITPWYCAETPGANIAKERQDRLAAADAIVLLVSPDLLSQRYDELERIFAAQRQGVPVFPILLRPTTLAGTPLDGVQTLPSDVPLSTHRNRDTVWVQIAQTLLTLMPQHGSGVTRDLLIPSTPPVPSLPPPATQPLENRATPISVLVLAADPSDSSRTRLGREVKELSQQLRGSPAADRFHLIQEWAVRTDELLKFLLLHRPTIVHFSGHGNSDSEIILEDPDGLGQAIPSDTLASLFEILNRPDASADPPPRIRCVVLNACYAEEQARLIAQHVDCAIGIRGLVHDKAVTAFTSGFYSALAAGKSFKTSYDLGLSQAKLLGHESADVFHLIGKPGLDLDKAHIL